MNRIVVFGVAIFFALVGIALVGGERNAEAGLFARSGGCNGCSDNGGCHGRRHNRCHASDCCAVKEVDTCSCSGKRCHGRHRCNGGCNGGCYGGEVVAVEKGAVQAPVQGPAVQAPVK